MEVCQRFHEIDLEIYYKNNHFKTYFSDYDPNLARLQAFIDRIGDGAG